MRKRRARYCKRVLQRVCQHVAFGSTLKAALEKEPLAPDMYVFWDWLHEYPELADMYDKARKMQAHLRIDCVAEMAEEVLRKPREAAAYKVASDIQCRLAEIADPEKYGRKTEIIHKPKTLNPSEMRKEINRLERELGLITVEGKAQEVTDVHALPSPEKEE